MSNLIIGSLGTPWITQATWAGDDTREAARRRRDRERERVRRNRGHRAP